MRRIRKMTWALVAWSVACLVWIVVGVANVAPDQDCIQSLGRELCQDATDAGAGIAVGLILTIWFVGFLVLSIVWFMSRPKGSES